MVPEIILHVDQLKLKSYRGNYDSFERQRAESMRHLAASATKQAGGAGTYGILRRALSCQGQQGAAGPKPAEGTGKDAANFHSPGRSGCRVPVPAALRTIAAPLMVLDQVRCGGMATRPSCTSSTCVSMGDDRIALLGVNGNGKSTFLKLLSGAISAAVRQDPEIQ